MQIKREMERTHHICKELSELIVYCRAVKFVADKIGNFTEMSSFSETMVEKYLQPPQVKFFLKYNHLQFSRVYPKGSRIDSSNYDPIKVWNCGVQMVALNYQTGDRAMQLNQAKFLLQNGGCGYLLRPEYMFSPNFDPYEPNTLENVETWVLTIKVIFAFVRIMNRCLTFCIDYIHLKVIGARHLMKRSRGITSPFVEIEVVGLDCDNVKYKTSTIRKLREERIFCDHCFAYVQNNYFNLMHFML